MSARHRLGCATLVLLAGAAQAAEPPGAAAPAMRTINTPAGPMLERMGPPTPTRTNSEPATEVESSPSGPMLVLRRPASSSSNARTLAAPTLPAGVRAEAMPNGAQMLVMPSRETPAAAIAARPIVDIDPAKPGTQIGDKPRSDALYRMKPVDTPTTR